MLTSNNISVQPSLLLNALPWETLLQQNSAAPSQAQQGEAVAQDIRKIHTDLLRWKNLGHLVNPQLAVDICKKVTTCLNLREIQKVIETIPENTLGVVQDALHNNDIQVGQLRDRHEQITALLAANKLAEAYSRAHAALKSLETVHNLLESARLRALESMRSTTSRQRTLWLASGSALVLGLTCEFLACIPSTGLSTLLPVLRDTVTAGAVICLSMASFVTLVSPDFASYLAQFRDAQDARLRLRLRLEEDINACLDQGFVPAHNH